MMLKASLTIFALTMSCQAFGQIPDLTPQKVDLVDRADVIADAASHVRATLALEPNRKVVVSGERPMTSMVLAAKEIELKPNSRIVIGDSDQSSGNYFIIADKIIVDDPEKPGVITWGRTGLSPPFDRGQAPSGSSGASAGANGGGGAEGAEGAQGTQGQRAPSLTIFVRTIANGGLIVDMRGNQGGPGGQGQRGGDGGLGAQGGNARQARKGLPFGGTVWLPYCEAGPGQGGTGGPGARGGIGGTGGIGGAGGSVTLVSLPQNLPTLFQVIRVNTGGGDGGKGGLAGIGGHGGLGGPEGHQANFCNSAHKDGKPGADGPSGSNGQNGPIGNAGQPFVAELEDSKFSSLFGF